MASYPMNGNVNGADGNSKNATPNGKPAFTGNGPFGGPVLTFPGDDMTGNAGLRRLRNPQNCTLGADDSETLSGSRLLWGVSEMQK